RALGRQALHVQVRGIELAQDEAAFAGGDVEVERVERAVERELRVDFSAEGKREVRHGRKLRCRLGESRRIEPAEGNIEAERPRRRVVESARVEMARQVLDMEIEGSGRADAGRLRLRGRRP